MWEVDTHAEWMDGITEFKFTFDGIHFTHHMEWTPMQTIERNASIRATWASPIKRAKQSAKLKLVHRNHDPAVNAKRSISLKRAYADPALRAMLSARKTAYWKAWRAARVTDSTACGTTEATRETPSQQV